MINPVSSASVVSQAVPTQNAAQSKSQLVQYAIDADVAGEGLAVSYWVE